MDIQENWSTFTSTSTLPDEDLLFHVTEKENAKGIMMNGLLPGQTASEIQIAEKRSDEEYDDMDGLYGRRAPEVEARTQYDDAMAEIRNAHVRDGELPDSTPHHQDDIFFFTTASDARRMANELDTDSVIIVVNASYVTNSLTPFIGDHHAAAALFERIYEQEKQDLSLHYNDQLELADEYWRTVREYDGGDKHGMEVFVNGEIPPNEIDGILC